MLLTCPQGSDRVGGHLGANVCWIWRQESNLGSSPIPRGYALVRKDLPIQGLDFPTFKRSSQVGGFQTGSVGSATGGAE